MIDRALVTSEVRGFVALLTLTRPEALNALSRDLVEQLADALAGADLDEGIRAVVITGWERAFWVGADIKELSGLMNARLPDRDGFGRRLFDGWSRCPSPWSPRSAVSLWEAGASWLSPVMS